MHDMTICTQYSNTSVVEYSVEERRTCTATCHTFKRDQTSAFETTMGAYAALYMHILEYCQYNVLLVVGFWRRESTIQNHEYAGGYYTLYNYIPNLTLYKALKW